MLKRHCPSSFYVRPARAGEAARIQEIEADAARRFEGMGLIDHALGDITPSAELLKGIQSGAVWVCCGDDDVSVGYARATVHESAAYLQEIDVLREYGRRGLGSQLVRHVCEWGRIRGLSHIVLATFLDVPWNAPFYAGLGFETVPEDEWTPEMHAIKQAEQSEMLLPWDRRGFFRKSLS
jgi:GNAT superfamily N-acetyltransferase